MFKVLRKFSVPQQASAHIPPSPEPDQGNALFEAFVCEFHWTVLQIGAVTNCMNACIAWKRAWTLRSCSNLFPVESPAVRAALHAWREIGLPQELAISLKKIFIDLSDAKRQTFPLVDEAGAFTTPSISSAKLHQMTALWRKLSEECEAAVQALEPEARWRLSGLFTANSLVLGKFIREAISGSHHYVNQVGEVAIPLLPQRRKTPRYVFSQPCILRDGNARSAAFAREISKNGIGLTCERDFQLKQRVLIELRTGRKMRGIIVWGRNKQVHVQFDEPLGEDDTLFARG